MATLSAAVEGRRRVGSWRRLGGRGGGRSGCAFSERSSRGGSASSGQAAAPVAHAWPRPASEPPPSLAGFWQVGGARGGRGRPRSSPLSLSLLCLCPSRAGAPCTADSRGRQSSGVKRPRRRTLAEARVEAAGGKYVQAERSRRTQLSLSPPLPPPSLSFPCCGSGGRTPCARGRTAPCRSSRHGCGRKESAFRPPVQGREPEIKCGPVGPPASTQRRWAGRRAAHGGPKTSRAPRMPAAALQSDRGRAEGRAQQMSVYPQHCRSL